MFSLFLCRQPSHCFGKITLKAQHKHCGSMNTECLFKLFKCQRPRCTCIMKAKQHVLYTHKQKLILKSTDHTQTASQDCFYYTALHVQPVHSSFNFFIVLKTSIAYYFKSKSIIYVIFLFVMGLPSSHLCFP